MARPKKQNREPFWFADRKAYYVHHGGKPCRLSPDKDEAWRLWHELMAKPPEKRQEPTPGPNIQAVEILDLFLDWCQKNQAPRTYDWHKDFCQDLTSTLPSGLLARDLKPYHITRVMDAHADWSNNTKHNFFTAVSRAFNWAVKQEIIDRNPIAHTEKPAREARELATTPADYDDVMAAIKEPNFRELIRFAWESGVRPQEARAIEARHVDFEGMRIVFPPKESKGKKKQVKIRLSGIDSPESGQDFGSRAKEVASSLTFGKTVTILPTRIGTVALWPTSPCRMAGP